MQHSNGPRSDDSYRRRFLISLIVVLCLGIALVEWWPAPTPSTPDGPLQKKAAGRIQIKDVQPTTQSQERKPPPPAPFPPVIVPDNAPIEDEIEFGDANLIVADPGEDRELQDGTSDTPTTGQQPDTSPRLFRAVQPKYPSAARENSVQARVQVAVQVSETGRVREATILKRWRVSAGGSARPVQQLDYGLEKAALIAARRSRFRPAQKNGDPVASRTTLTFEFGTSTD